MNWTGKWIKSAQKTTDVVLAFTKKFTITQKPVKAELFVTAMGVYVADMNGTRIGDFILAPGWTSYYTRLQYQKYDITELLSSQNEISISLGKGWYHSRMPGWRPSSWQSTLRQMPEGVLAEIHLTYANGETEIIGTDDSWLISETATRFSEIYDGEICDVSFEKNTDSCYAEIFDGPWNTLIAQEGPEIHEQERLCPARIFTTPAGETVIDFGQEITGYVEISVEGKKGEQVVLSHGEMLDKYGNFYNANYRSAKCQYIYTCRDGHQIWHPQFTFFGFRYIRIDQFPGGIQKARPENFTAIAIYSDMERTGTISCSDSLLNNLFSNIIWGQKCNFVDVPTDCPQRDERLGWTGDAQVFIKTACLNFDTEQFYSKWLADMAADQFENGCIGHVVPNLLQDQYASSAWGDAAVICPWEIYMAYGDKEILRRQFTCMKGWIRYITGSTKNQYLWTGGTHYGDWLGLDAPAGSYKGASREDFIASAFYAHSTELLIKAGLVLEEDMSEYQQLYNNILSAFRKAFPTYKTQTEFVLAIQFHLAPDLQKAADQLAKMIIENGTKLQTGFVGTPYLLHVLSAYGYSELAYSLLLRKEYPSWLYPVTKGATTIWEHWDGIMENGDFWSTDMNSFNHYAYGSVADWIYCVAAGINTVEDAPGYEKISFTPTPDSRLDWLKVTLKTRHGYVESQWKKENGNWRYEITTPVDSEVNIAGRVHHVLPGTYYFYSPIR